MKLVLNERNKIFYGYLVIQNMIKNRYVDNLIFFVFIFTKFNLYLIQQQIESLIFELKPEKFQQLQNESIEELRKLQKTTEFYEYSKILQQEEHQIKKNLQFLKKQLEYFFKTTQASNNIEDFEDVYIEFQQLEVFNVGVYLKYMNLYLLHIYNQYQQYKTIDLLRHINEILDLIGIDQFFENLLDFN